MNEKEKTLAKEREIKENTEGDALTSPVTEAAEIDAKMPTAEAAEMPVAEVAEMPTAEVAEAAAEIPTAEKAPTGAAPKAPTFREKYGEVISLAIGECAVVILTVLGFAIYNLLTEGVALYKVILGAVLGAAVTVANMLILAISVNKAVNRYLELRGEGEMSDEEAEKFAGENAVIIQNAVTRSYLFRTVSMVAVLVGALLLPCFNVIATVIPLVMYRPLMYISELLKKRRSA